jgi:hypothetical protein
MANLQYGVNFNGRRIVHPGAHSKIDASAMTIVTEGSINTPVIIGNADSGKSGEVHWFTDISEARKYLTSGELVTGAELLFSPTPEGGGGASVIGVIVANETKPSKLANGPIEFESLAYGEIANRVQVKVEGASGSDIPGTKRLTLYRWDTDEQEIYTNLGAVVAIKYVGDEGTIAKATIAKDGTTGAKTLKVLLGDTGSEVEDISIELGSDRFFTINDVVTYLNSVSGYEVTFVGYRNATMESKLLDVTSTPVDIANKVGYLNSKNGDVIHQINSFSELVKAKLTDETDTTYITDIPFTYLTGGAVGSTSPSWANLFEPLKETYSNVLVVLNSKESVHAEALQHITVMETRQQPQMLFTGGTVGEPPSVVKQRAAVLNSSRAVLGYPGIHHSTYRNGRDPLPAYFTGALIAGRVCGLGPSDPVTFEYFNLIGLERKLIAGDPIIDDLITSGVAVLEKAQNGGIRLVQGVTTYLSENNTLYREISVRRGADYLAEEVRSALETAFVGKKHVGPDVTSSIITKAVDVLEKAKKDGHIVEYRNIRVRFSGTTIYVDYEVAPSTPINFILITSRFVPEIAQ